MSRLRIAVGAALCGGIGAGLYAAALDSSPGAMLLVYLTQLPLFAAGLWLGLGAAVLAGIVGAAILVPAGGGAAALLFAGLDAVPVAVLVRQALLRRRGKGEEVGEWYPPGLLVAWLTGLTLAGGAAALLLFGGPQRVEASLRAMTAPLSAALTRGLGAAERDHAIRVLVGILPGMALASWMTMTAINGILAQALVARFGRSRRPSPDFATLSLPSWLPILLGVAAVLATLEDARARFVGIAVLILLVVPFALAGLSVLHGLVRRLSRPGAVLACFYLVAGLFGWPMLLVAVLGLVDSAVGLRRPSLRP